MAYHSNQSSLRYAGDGDRDRERRSDRRNNFGGGYGGGHPQSRGGPSQNPGKNAEPFLMQNYFMSEHKSGVLRDVLKIRIRHHLGNNATSWFGQNEETGEFGHFYRAERPFTKEEMVDLRQATSEYIQDPQGFQRRLNGKVWDTSQWTDQGEPGYNGIPSGPYPSSQPGYPAEYPQGSQPPYEYDQSGGAYMTPGNDRYSASSGYGQHQTQEPGYSRKGKSKHAGDYDYQGSASMSAYSGAPSSGMAYAGDTGASGYGPGNTMTSGYGGAPMDLSATYPMPGTGSVTGTAPGVYADPADQFLDTMPAPGGGPGYETNYGQGSSSNPDCHICKKKSGKCKCKFSSR